MLEELENYLILDSSRLRTFEDARLEIVTYVEAMFVLRIRDSKPSDTGLREHSDPTDVGAVNSLSSVQGKWSSGPSVGCFKCGGAPFQRDGYASKNTGKQSSGKGNQSKLWSKSEPSMTGKGKCEEHGTKGAIQGSESSVENKLSTIGISGLENLKSETSSETQDSMQLGQVCTTDTWIHDEWRCDEWNDGKSLDEWNDDWSHAGWHEDCEQTYNTSVSSFSLKISEWVKMNIDTGAAVNTFPFNLDPEGAGDGTFHGWIPDGEAWQFQGNDEKWFTQISEWKTHGCTPSVVHRCVSICTSRLQRTTRLLFGDTMVVT